MNKIKIGEKIEDKKLYNIYIAKVTPDVIENIELNLTKYGQSTYKVKHEMNDKFQVIHGFKLTNIIAYGDTNVKNSNVLSKFIVGKHITQQLGNGVEDTNMAYPCFRGDSYIYTNEFGLIMHQDKMSSWNCLLDKINKWDNILIYKDNG